MSDKNTKHKKQNAKINEKNINKNYSGKRKELAVNYNSKYHFYLLFTVLCIIPLIVRMVKYNTNLSQFAWFADSGYQFDFFLFYKQWFFIFVAGIMAVIIAYKAYFSRKTFKCSVIFIPLAIYALFALLSAIFSHYASICFSGGFELFESVFTLLGYCILAYYTFIILNSERDFQIIYYFLITIALILSILGACQFFGHDFFSTELGYNLIVPTDYRGSDLSFNFGANIVYMTLYNPNYVGVLGSLLIPVIFVMTFFQKKVIWFILSALSIIGLVICIVGARSLTGVIGLGLAIICIIIFTWRYLFKRFYIVIPIIVILILGVVLINNLTDHYFYNKLKSALQFPKTEYALTRLVTENDKVSLTYNGNTMNVTFVLNSDNTAAIIAFDQDNMAINNTFDANTAIYTITDNRFPGFFLGFNKETDGVFYIQEEGRIWYFTKLTEDGTYYYINRFNKLDKIIEPQTALFTDYEGFASRRGYIWSRTLPLLKKYIFLGSGPDTFTIAYPQEDYLGLIQNGMGSEFVTKPHNMYLQMGVQTGVLSLIAFLTFYLMYFISSIRLYIRGRFNSFYAKFGVAIFIGTVSYMVTGLANDSNINTAPIFWTLMGVGIAINGKAKPLIREEIAAIKEKKAEARRVRNDNGLSAANENVAIKN